MFASFRWVATLKSCGRPVTALHEAEEGRSPTSFLYVIISALVPTNVSHMARIAHRTLNAFGHYAICWRAVQREPYLLDMIVISYIYQ